MGKGRLAEINGLRIGNKGSIIGSNLGKCHFRLEGRGTNTADALQSLKEWYDNHIKFSASCELETKIRVFDVELSSDDYKITARPFYPTKEFNNLIYIDSNDYLKT